MTTAMTTATSGVSLSFWGAVGFWALAVAVMLGVAWVEDWLHDDTRGTDDWGPEDL